MGKKFSSIWGKKIKTGREAGWELPSFFFFSFNIWKFPGKGSNQSCSCRPPPQPQQCRMRMTSVTYTTALSNVGSLTHWARPGMEPASSWILVANSWTLQVLKILLYFREISKISFLNISLKDLNEESCEVRNESNQTLHCFSRASSAVSDPALNQF